MKHLPLIAALIVVALLMTWCDHALAEIASFYHEPQRIACGKGMFNPKGITAASRVLPCGARVTICYRGKCVENVRINDHGPAKRTGRDIDVSLAVAQRLGFVKAGVVHVTVTRTDRHPRASGA
jgi:rare lipoprotein A